MDNIINLKGVHCYVDQDTGMVMLNLEDVARGLGFTEIAASGNECIKWSRVRGYLKDLKFIDTSVDGSPEVGKDQFIPENIFYRLAMKAKNETAQKFQALIADEILPSIRKHGTYMTPETIEKVLTDPDTIIKLAMTLKEERQARLELQAKIEEDSPFTEFGKEIADHPGCIKLSDFARILDYGAITFNNMLRNDGILMKDSTVPYRQFIEKGYFKVTEVIKYGKIYPVTLGCVFKLSKPDKNTG